MIFVFVKNRVLLYCQRIMFQNTQFKFNLKWNTDQSHQGIFNIVYCISLFFYIIYLLNGINITLCYLEPKGIWARQWNRNMFQPSIFVLLSGSKLRRSLVNKTLLFPFLIVCPVHSKDTLFVFTLLRFSNLVFIRLK